VSNLSGLLDRGRVMGELGRSAGFPFPYQWVTPGRNARPVMAVESAVLSGVLGTTTAMNLYVVPVGMRFFLSSIVIEFVGDGWAVGGDDLLMSFVLRGASVERPLQYLSNLRFPFGSMVDGSFSLPCALEMVAFDEIRGEVLESTGLVPSGGRVVMGVFGYEVPESDSFL
jgi:hypothetical protein